MIDDEMLVVWNAEPAFLLSGSGNTRCFKITQSPVVLLHPLIYYASPGCRVAMEVL
jgi:hypothetical protein